MSVTVGGRKFISELNGFVDKTVKVITTRGVAYEGKLLGFDGSSLSICLEDATVNKERFARAIIRGRRSRRSF